MPSSAIKGKRPAGHDSTISPPPTKRKAQSAISQNAVASFFTPTSQKPKDRASWTERAADDRSKPTLLVATYDPEDEGKQEPSSKRRKIAAFDLDSTLITSSSGKKHADEANDWKWWDSSVPGKLKDLYHKDGYRIVIFTNQGGLTLHQDPKSKAPKSLKNRVMTFKQKCNAVLSNFDFPLTLYAATGKDIFRKPRTGMWKELCDDYGLIDHEIELRDSIFVGDAGGRTALLKGGTAVAKDFSCSDRNFAHNVGIPFQTPEEFFLGEKARDFTREFDLSSHPFSEVDGASTPDTAFKKENNKDIILFCGSPGAGKSTFYWKHLKPLGYERVNQDILKSKDKCFKAATDYLSAGGSVVVDNTNPDPDTRGQWVELAKKNKVPIRCIWFKTPASICEHNNIVRALNKTMNPEARESLPKLAFNGFASRFKEPKKKEGFQDIVQVEFRFQGTKEEYSTWGRYWL